MGCSDVNPQGVQRYPQPLYNVGRLSVAAGPTCRPGRRPALFATSVDFTSAMGEHINAELPSDGALIADPDRQGRGGVGILDDIIFFIAMLPTADDPDGLHPYLAQGVRRGDRFEIIPLAEDVEDLQIAYGVDGSQGAAVDEAISRVTAASTYDTDPNSSNVADGDEWRPNVQPDGAETPFTDVEFQSAAAPLGNHPRSAAGGALPAPARGDAVAAGQGARSRIRPTTDRRPRGTSSWTSPSTAPSRSPRSTGKYRRRVQTLRINLRNYAFQG